MKRKIAILLAAVMTTAALPMNVSANSSNSINKVQSVKVDDMVTGVYLTIQPNDEILSGDSIIISVENGEFPEEKDYKLEQYNKKFKYRTDSEVDGAMNLYDSLVLDAGSEDKVDFEKLLEKVLDTENDGTKTNELPYFLKRVNSKEMEVSLFPLAKLYANKDFATVGKPIYRIPLNVEATTSGDVKVTIDANGTSVSGGGTYTIANSTSSSGSTTTSVDEVKSFMDKSEMNTITVKENVKNTFKVGEKVKIRLSGGFKIADENKVKITSGTNAEGLFNNVAVTVDEDEITFVMPELLKKGETERTKPLSFNIEGLWVEAEDEDEDWGDVNITVTGAGITRETIKIAERADYGFKLTAVEEPTTIFAGRLYQGNTSRLSEDDFVAAEFKFEETIENTWIEDRKLEFYVPEGIKIVDAEFNDEENISTGHLDAAVINNEGTTLRIDKKSDASFISSRDECVAFKVKLYLSADADYTGDVTVNVKGGGIAEGVIEGVVIANVVSPIKIESATTKTNVGYQKVDSADITITEADAGIMLKNEEVIIELDGAYKTEDIGFSDDGLDYEISGDLEVTNFKVSNGAITFKVDKESYKEPSSITIKNVKVGSTRSVSYGSYDINVYGGAIVNNYDEDRVKDISYPVNLGSNASANNGEAKSDLNRLGYFDTTEKYAFKDYVTVVTETGTLDSVVKVTIGEKTVLVDETAYDMDVAPYIQTASASTMVPIRFVSIALGIDTSAMSNPDESSKVVWDANTKTATILYAAGNGQKIVQFVAGSNNMIVDGTPIPMSNGVKAEIVDGRMFVPFRAVGNAFGVSVSWDEATRTAIYNQK